MKLNLPGSYAVVPTQVPGADPRIYEEVADMSQLQPTIEEYLNDYNAESKQPMPLVMFMAV